MPSMNCTVCAGYAWVIPEQIAIGQAWKAFGPDGKILDEKLSQRFDQFAQSLVENTRKTSRCDLEWEFTNAETQV